MKRVASVGASGKSSKTNQLLENGHKFKHKGNLS